MAAPRRRPPAKGARAPQAGPQDISTTVRDILLEIRNGGDAALRRLTRQLDGVDVPNPLVSPQALRASWRSLDRELRRALDECARRLSKGQRALLPKPIVARTARGIRLRTDWVPLRRIGAYAPGGRAAYPSTVLMTCVTAGIAGVDEVLLASPPQADGVPSRLVQAAAYRSGATATFAMGGAQALAAFAYGTATVPRVDKIVGPGNAFVLEAKRQLFGTVGIDALAGPSELAIWADGTTDPRLVALDAAAQAEHDPRARILVVTPDQATAQRIRSLLRNLARDGERSGILRESLGERAEVRVVRDVDEAVEVLEDAAAEHVQLPAGTRLASRLRCAGTIFEGPYACASLGDYATGANHVLPTGGAARWSSPLSVYDFLRQRTRQQVTRAGLQAAAPAALALARAEGLPNHAASIAGGR